MAPASPPPPKYRDSYDVRIGLPSDGFFSKTFVRKGKKETPFLENKKQVRKKENHQSGRRHFQIRALF